MSHVIPDTHTLVLSTPLPAGSRIYIGEGLYYEAGTDIVLTVVAPKGEPALPLPLSDVGTEESERADG